MTLAALIVTVGLVVFLAAMMGTLIGNLTSNVVSNLLSNQIEAWLPVISRRLLRWGATLMGSRAARCEEEWLCDLDQTRGGLAKPCFAVGMLRVPCATLLLRWRLAPLRQKIAWAKNSAWTLPIVAIVVLLVKYPPHESRYPAYTVLIPLLLCCSLGLSRRAEMLAEG